LKQSTSNGKLSTVNSNNDDCSPRKVQNKSSDSGKKTTKDHRRSNSRTVNWSSIHSKLPLDDSAKDKERRKAMFRQFDPNGNGYLSLAEIDKGIRDVLGIEEMFDAKPAIIRAFNAAKNATQGRSQVSSD